MKKVYITFISIFCALMSLATFYGCSDDEKEDDSVYCWDFTDGTAVTTQCCLTESEADFVLKQLHKQGYTSVVKKKR